MIQTSMSPMVAILIIMIPAFIYFVITFYANNSTYINLVAGVVWDRMKDHFCFKWEIALDYYYEYKFNTVKRIVSTYKSAVSCFKK